MKSPELLRQILEAYYEAEFANPSEQAQKTRFLESLIDQAIEGTPYSRLGFIEIIAGRYKEYRRARKKQEGIPKNLLEGEQPPLRES